MAKHNVRYRQRPKGESVSQDLARFHRYRFTELSTNTTANHLHNQP